MRPIVFTDWRAEVFDSRQQFGLRRTTTPQLVCNERSQDIAQGFLAACERMFWLLSYLDGSGPAGPGRRHRDLLPAISSERIH